MYLVMVRKVEGRWVVDEDSSHIFEREGEVFANGAIQEIEVRRITPLRHHPRNPVSHQTWED